MLRYQNICRRELQHENDTKNNHQSLVFPKCSSSIFAFILPGIDKFIYSVKFKLVSRFKVCLLLCSLFFSLSTICETSIVVKIYIYLVPPENYWSSILFFFLVLRKSKTWPHPEFYQIKFYSLITWFAYGTREMPFSFMVSNFPPFLLFFHQFWRGNSCYHLLKDN